MPAFQMNVWHKYYYESIFLYYTLIKLIKYNKNSYKKMHVMIEELEEETNTIIKKIEWVIY